MPQLSDSQLVVLTAACQRPDRCVFPVTAKLKGNAAGNVLKSLLNKGLIKEVRAKRDDTVYRHDEERGRITLIATNAAFAALGIDTGDDDDEDQDTGTDGADNAAADIAGPGCATYRFASLGGLHAALDRVYKLAVSLPEEPLSRFRTRTAGMPQTTEAERLVVQRVGQDIFREALMDYWGGRCPLTGITEPALLHASHIVPWADCEDEQRLDVYNGLLLSALWDAAAFDKGLVSFGDDGAVLVSPNLSGVARKALGVDHVPPLKGLRSAHQKNLAAHRLRHGL